MQLEQSASATAAHLKVHDLRVIYETRTGPVVAVDGVDLTVSPGEAMGLVGESGSGKSSVVKAILRLLPAGTHVDGDVLLDGTSVFSMTDEALRQIRWTRLALVTQSAMASLDPVATIGQQIVDGIRAHSSFDRRKAWTRARELFGMVGLPPERLKDYPHQFSGGMRQRAVIAMALSMDAGILVADEPTSALDSLTQKRVLEQLRELKAMPRRSLVLVSHDIGVISQICSLITVMYAGRVVESGPTGTVLSRPAHPYSMGLTNAFPTLEEERGELISIPGQLPTSADENSGCRFAPRCPFRAEICWQSPPPLIQIDSDHWAACHFPDRAAEFRTRAGRRSTWVGATPRGTKGEVAAGAVNGSPETRNGRRHDQDLEYKESGDVVLSAVALSMVFDRRRGLFDGFLAGRRRPVQAVSNVDLRIRRGEILGLVGESGSGKSTLGMCLTMLHTPTKGSIVLLGESLTGAGRRVQKQSRKLAQIVFQDPYAALNPRMTIREAVEEPLRAHKLGNRAQRTTRVEVALGRVSLDPATTMDRYPHELSGGQRQRVCIARALVLEPAFMVADEPTSMLDVSVRAGILDLFRDLAERDGLAVLYISHDIATVRHIASRVAVMKRGRIVEEAPTERLLRDARHPYTRALLAAASGFGGSSQVSNPVTDGFGTAAISDTPRTGEPLIEVAADHWVRQS